MFGRFVQEEMNHYIEKAVEWAKKLPMRDGDVDMEALGATIEELRTAMITEVAVPSAPEVIEKFLQEHTSKPR